MRFPDDVWLPALAWTVADETTVTGLVEDTLREHGSARPLNFAAMPAAGPWLEAHFSGWRNLASAIQAALPGLADTGYIGVALWLALTRRRDVTQQRHVFTGFLLSRAMAAEPGGWRENREGAQVLLTAINQVLDEYLPAR